MVGTSQPLVGIGVTPVQIWSGNRLGSQVSEPSLRAGVLGLLQVHSQAVVRGGGQ